MIKVVKGIPPYFHHYLKSDVLICSPEILKWELRITHEGHDSWKKKKRVEESDGSYILRAL